MPHGAARAFVRGQQRVLQKLRGLKAGIFLAFSPSRFCAAAVYDVSFRSSGRGTSRIKPVGDMVSSGVRFYPGHFLLTR